MHQGNWKCSSCGGKITELPFQPRSESGLTCRSCWGKQKDKETELPPEMDAVTESEVPFGDIPEDAGVASEPMPTDDGLDTSPVKPAEGSKFSGDWKCAGCGGAITSLPFEPKDTSNLKCLDCFKRSRE